MATFLCLVDCLMQKHETDSLGRYVELVNLRAKANEVYDSEYDLREMNDNPEGTIFFQAVNAPPTKKRGSDLAPLEKRMPKPQVKAESKPRFNAPAKRTAKTNEE